MDHVLQLYQEEGCLLDALAEYVAAGLRLDEGVLIIGSTPRWELLLDRLQRARVDARGAALRGQLRLFGAHVVLSTCQGAQGIERRKFNEVLNGVLSMARMRYERVRVFSELTDTCWREGGRESARSVEQLWKPLLGVHDFTLLCACSIDSLEGNAYDGTLQALCQAHTHVHPARDAAGFDDAVSGALAEVLDEHQVQMLHTLANAHRPAAQMPSTQAMLFWLKDHMPRTAEKVMSRARARWNEQ